LHRLHRHRTVINYKINFGSVSSNRTHFERSVKRPISIEHEWPELLEKMFTRIVTLDNVADSLHHNREDIKVILETGR
jgi:hypothetical protein